MSRDAYAGIVHRLFPGATLEAATRLAGGVSADVQRFDLRSADGSRTSVVLRAHGASHSGHSANLEYRLLQTLHRGGLPVPEPLLLDASGSVLPYPFLVMAFVEGHATVPAEREDDYVEAMADLLAKIHAFPTDALPPLPARNDPLPEVLDFLPEEPEWKELRAHLRSLGDTAYRGPPRLLHGDFWPENVLWRNGTVAAVLDWEDAALGDPLSDVACCGLELRYKIGEAGMETFTRAYAKQRAVDDRRLALWQVYVAAAAQHFMGKWGLAPAREAHMRAEALASIREAGAVLTGIPALMDPPRPG